MDSFKLLTRTANLAVYSCPQCRDEFATATKPKRCPRCKFPDKGSDYALQVKRAKSEIRNIIREQGYIRSATELQPLIDSLLCDFPKSQRADILGQLALDRDRIRRERYNIDLHQYAEEKLRSSHDREEAPRRTRTFERALAEEETTEDPILIWLNRMKRKQEPSSGTC